jgi:PhnB protein
VATASVYLILKEISKRLFIELSAGGTITMPMNMTFWSSYYGMLTDKFGINLMVSFSERQA